ncbi:4'-phosphopantetheinyl transferase superfamily protein [Corynebacterium sp. 153RC1]|uniref:4'-phosphopantetheinyl transferase family protein n=1 Tax=Corynebacterium TaxID=1716 RepID=UPI00211C4905|nr:MULTISPECIES: 4'-phosphopantetheinyl transferase superfamily protein [unclassified Corynebacterium]MCQ9371018.1 4'-phosphopantetheinyl transferase superfamily protein [Corynebacterium sp. 35RC1]MCQ9342413.1 4'-phosphopantetheinyl transferase superfamily protein [Corynebacterium sp. 76QC2CO]MCQ9351597.1 4'-phosphopantetheinyl transferase superfamily protein [Corynebacterium sp. 209RC1]MCQ9353966.1 4'-phosphopantetheinyl transferase superfamily protein [Corynebacterium sp. 1222RC1]MCQ9355880.
MLDASLFPPAAQFAQLEVPPAEHNLENFARLHPLERALVSHAVDARKAEFGDARWCAHQALAKLGRDAGGPILRGERGMPLWPAAVSGSLTHTDGFRAAVCAPSLLVRSMGLDAERAEPLPEGVVGSIARVSELAQLERLRENKGITCADRLLFCAKEATYKAWFPLTHRWLGFEQAEIDLRDDGTFVSYLLVRPTPVPFIEGKWKVADGYIVATTAVL